MKKIKLLTIFVCALMIMTGCSNSSQESSQETLNMSDVRVNGQIISLDENVEDVISFLGDYDLQEYKSCLFEGNDKTFTFNDCIINTYPNGEKDLINSITVLTKQSEIFKDIHIGDTIEDIYSVLKEDNVKLDAVVCIYETDDYGIAFYLDNNQIEEIEVYLIQS